MLMFQSDMLIYIRQSAMDELLHDIQEDEIPIHLKNRFEKEIEEDELVQKELAEVHLFANLKVKIFISRKTKFTVIRLLRFMICLTIIQTILIWWSLLK